MTTILNKMLSVNYNIFLKIKKKKMKTTLLEVKNSSRVTPCLIVYLGLMPHIITNS